MKKEMALMAAYLMLSTLTAWTQTVFVDGISVSNDYVRHIGLIDVAGWGTESTGAVRHLGVSYGQLAGIDPGTGVAIADVRNLLPLKVQSVVAVSNITSFAGFFGNGVGITNLPAEAYTETDPVFILWLGTNTYIKTEADPIWTTASNLYYLKSQVQSLFATGTPIYTESDPFFAVWLGTNSYVQIEADPVWAGASNQYYTKIAANALFATGTPLYAYTETDPGFTTWLGTNAYVKTETDPVWSTERTNCAAAGWCVYADNPLDILTTGVLAQGVIPYDCTIKEVTLLSTEMGTATVDIYIADYDDWPLTSADSITASAKPATVGTNKYRDAILSGWTTALTNGQVFMIKLEYNAGHSNLSVNLKLEKD